MRYTSISEELEVTKFKKRVEREFEGYFEKNGFNLIEPRIFQKYDMYVRSNFRQDSSRTVKVLSGNSRIYILRPDITTNILGEIFSKWDGEPPLKVYYNSKIYLNRPDGKILENYQMGIESLGEDVFKADQEIVHMGTRLMGTLGRPVILELGSSKYLDGLFKELDLDQEEESEIRDLISKKNRYGLRIRLKELDLEGTVLDHIFELQGDMREVIQRANSHPMNSEMREAIDELESLMEGSSNRYSSGEIKFDLSMLPDLDYYDGIIFKGYCLGVPNKILSGGRYDRLTEEFGLRVPAIGFMIDLDLVTRIRMEEER
ncbi:MAG: ATP phosphoribosyltransferase regulatory subunit [Gudongella sp.]|nr:ATP phosphoribosyltransferase regulatory subunit [Gudongella sp.]